MVKLLTSLMLLCGLVLAGCGRQGEPASTQAPPAAAKPTAEAPAAPAAAGEPVDIAGNPMDRPGTHPVAGDIAEAEVGEQPEPELPLLADGPLEAIADPTVRAVETARRALLLAREQVHAHSYAAAGESFDVAAAALRQAQPQLRGAARGSADAALALLTDHLPSNETQLDAVIADVEAAGQAG